MTALASWSRGRISKKSAKDALAETPESKTFHGVAVPFPVGSKEDYKSKHSNREINRAIEKAKIRSVPLDKLIAIQHSVKPARVEQYIDDPNLIAPGTRDKRHGGLIDYPIVIQQDGKLYCHDGHHRCAASKLLGDKSVEARFIDFDKGEK